MTLFTFIVILMCVITFAYITWANASNSAMDIEELREELACVNAEHARRLEALEKNPSVQELKRAYIALGESHLSLTSDLTEWRDLQEKLNKKLCDAPNDFSKKAKKFTADLALLEGCMTEYQKDLNDNTKALETCITVLRGHHHHIFKDECKECYGRGEIVVCTEEGIKQACPECTHEGAADRNTFDGTIGGDHTDALGIPYPPTGDEGGPATF